MRQPAVILMVRHRVVRALKNRQATPTFDLGTIAGCKVLIRRAPSRRRYIVVTLDSVLPARLHRFVRSVVVEHRISAEWRAAKHRPDVVLFTPGDYPLDDGVSATVRESDRPDATPGTWEIELRAPTFAQAQRYWSEFFTNRFTSAAPARPLDTSEPTAGPSS